MKKGFSLIEVLLSLVIILAFSFPLFNEINLLRKVVLSSNQNYVAIINAKNILECITSFGDYTAIKEINDFEMLKNNLGIIISDDPFFYNITINNEDFSHTISSNNALLKEATINFDSSYANSNSPIDYSYDFEIHENNGVESYIYKNTPLNTNNKYINFNNNVFKFLIQKDDNNNPVNIFKGEKFILKIKSNDISNLKFDFNNLEYENIIVVIESDVYTKLNIIQNSMSLLITEQLPKKINYITYYITVSVYNSDKKLIKTLTKISQLKKDVMPL